MRSSLHIKEEKESFKQKMIQIYTRCKEEIRDITDQESKEIEEYRSKIDSLNKELNQFNNKQNKNIMEKKFSLISAIRSVSNNKALDNLSQAVVEAGSNEMRKAGLNYVGQIQLPSNEMRGLTVADEGEDVVATDLMDVVTPLKAKNVLLQAGARFVPGLVGDLQYPVMSSANVSWEGETAKAKDANITFSNVKLSPKRLSVVVPISKQFIVQDSVGAEAAIREEIFNAINSKLEATVLGAEQGSTTQPAGLFYTASGTAVPTVSDFAKLTDFEAGLEDANVVGDMKYLVSPKAKAALRNMVKGAKSTALVFENGEVDGTPALCTSNLKDKFVAYGDFSNLVLAQWGNLDITVDNVTLAAEGQIRLVVNAYFDAKVLRPEAIKVAKVG
jgi:phage capsid family|nr:MAG TPA: major capsid protein [Caudoviricetes sp.]